MRRKDYHVSFENVQKLQLVRRRLLRTLSALESSLEVADGCLEFFKDHSNLSKSSADEFFPAFIKNYSMQMTGHIRRVHRLLTHIDGTSNLVLLLRFYCQFMTADRK